MNRYQLELYTYRKGESSVSEITITHNWANLDEAETALEGWMQLLTNGKQDENLKVWGYVVDTVIDRMQGLTTTF